VIAIRRAVTRPIAPPMATAIAISMGLAKRERGGDRDQHACHAVAVACLRGGGAGETAQREDEQHARDQIGERGPGRRSGELLHQRAPGAAKFMKFTTRHENARWACEASGSKYGREGVRRAMMRV